MNACELQVCDTLVKAGTLALLVRSESEYSEPSPYVKQYLARLQIAQLAALDAARQVTPRYILTDAPPRPWWAFWRR